MASLIGQPAAAQGMANWCWNPRAASAAALNKSAATQGPCARVVIEQVDNNYITISSFAAARRSNSLSLGGTTATPLNCRLSKCR